MTGPAPRAVAPGEVRRALRDGEEIGLIDVRPEAPFAEGHPLFAACLPLDRLELEAVARIPRRSAPLVVYGDTPADAELAAARLRSLGFTAVAVLEGGLRGWVASGGELFRDVNAPSKAFGELVAERLATPSLDATELRDMLDRQEAVTVLDARRYDEYRTMSIPTAASAPGATLVRTVAGLGRREGLVVVNCAGRTRSIIGTQSVINAGVAPRVVALRNGTIGWTLAGLPLEHGQDRRVGPPGQAAVTLAADAARRVADRAGVTRLRSEDLPGLPTTERTVYRFDVRMPDRFEIGHLPGFTSAPGGQLVQETDRYAPVRGALVVLVDDDGTEADMTGSWLAQMGWDVVVVDGVRAADGGVAGPGPVALPPAPPVEWWTPEMLDDGLRSGPAVVVDVDLHRRYEEGHVPGAGWVSRSELARPGSRPAAGLPADATVVVTSHDDILTALAVDELGSALPSPVVGLDGGTPGWRRSGRPLEAGPGVVLSPPADRYRRPYEGTDVDAAAMQAYLDWEYGLVEQLGRDGTHRFTVLDVTAPQAGQR